MSLSDDVQRYYAARAEKYNENSECNGSDVEQRLATIKAILEKAFKGHDVLEIACGTGYWTEVVAKTASSILATDVNLTMVALAQKRLAGFKNVRFLVSDAYSLDSVPEGFTAAFAVLWWCHIPKSRIRQFLSVLHSKLTPGAFVLFRDQLADDDAAEHRSDTDGNILAERMANGRKFLIVKNIPTEKELLEILSGVAEHIEYSQDRQWGSWSVSYAVKKG